LCSITPTFVYTIDYKSNKYYTTLPCTQRVCYNLRKNLYSLHFYST